MTLVVLAGGVVAAAVSGIVAWPGPALVSGDGPDDEVALPDDVRFEDPSTDDAQPGRPDSADPDSADPDPSDPPDPPADANDPGGAASGELGCEPDGCERWRIEDGSLGRLVVGDDALAYVNIDELTVVDIDTAGVRYRGPIELADGQPPGTPPNARYLDDDLLVLVFDEQVVGLDPADGDHLWSAELDGGPPQSITEHEGDLILIGVAHDSADAGDSSALVGSRPRTTIAVLTGDGQVRWQDEFDMIVTWPWVEPHPFGQAEDESLLVVDGDELVRRSLGDGRSRWRRDVDTDQHLLGWQPPMLSRSSADEIEVIDTATGELRSRIVRTDPAWAHPLGPWVQVGTDDTIYVHDRDTGRELFSRGREDGVMPNSPGVAVEVGDGDDARIALGWSSASVDASPIIDVHHLDGSHDHTIELPAADTGDGSPRLRQLEPLADGAVRAIAGNVLIADVDVRSGEVLHTSARRVDDATYVYVHGGLVIVGGQDGLELEGPDGAVRVDGRAPAVEHRDPLLVRDGTTLLRIDERLLER